MIRNKVKGKRVSSVVDSDFVIVHLLCMVVHVCSNVRTFGNHYSQSTVGIKKVHLGWLVIVFRFGRSQWGRGHLTLGRGPGRQP